MAAQMTTRIGGLTGWFLARLRGGRRAGPRLALVERIALGPRQWLSLVEAEGRRILVATSAEGGPAFYPLEPARSSEGRAGEKTLRAPRVSW